MIVKKKGIASEIVLDIIDVMEKTNENEYVYIDRSFWDYPYDEHLYITIVNTLTKKCTNVIEYYRVKKNEAIAIPYILKEMGGHCEKIGKNYGKMYNYKTDYWVVENEGREYAVYYLADSLLKYRFRKKNEAKIICDFLNKEGVKQLRR